MILDAQVIGLLYACTALEISKDCSPLVLISMEHFHKIASKYLADGGHD